MPHQVDYKTIEQKAQKIEPAIRRFYIFFTDFPLRVFSTIFFAFSIYAYFTGQDIGHSDLILELFISIALFINRLYYYFLRYIMRKAWLMYKYFRG